MGRIITDIPHRMVNAGNLSGAIDIHVYGSGTSTPVNIYSDPELTSPIANPLSVGAGSPVPALYHGFAGDIRIEVTGGGNTIFDDDPYDRPLGELILASADSDKGSALVGFQQTGSYAASRFARDELIESVKVTQFTGADDCEQFENAFSAHPGRVIHIPYRTTPYSITRKLVPPANTTIMCEKGVKFSLDYDGDAIELLSGVYIHDMTLLGNGATQMNGRGVVIDGSNGRNGLIDCEISDVAGPCISFLTTLSGSYFYARNANLSRHSGGGLDSSSVVIEMADGALAGQSVPRVFVSTRTNGYATANLGGCNDVFFTGGGYHGPFYFSEYSRGIKIAGIRWGNQTIAHIRGCNISISGCGIAPQLIIDAATIDPGVLASGHSITIAGNDMNNPRVEDNSGFSRTNSIHHCRVTDTGLTIKADGTTLTIGAGNNRNGVYRNGQEFCIDIDLQGSWQGGVAVPGGLGFASSITIDVPADYMPIYEQFVGPFDMTYNGAQKVVWGRLFGTTTGAGNLIRLGYFNATGDFVQYRGIDLDAGPVTRLRGTARWTR